MCNPILIFDCIIEKAYTATPKLNVVRWIEPSVDRKSVESIGMPPYILGLEEYEKILEKADPRDVERNLVPGKKYSDFKSGIENLPF